ncbi:MAG: carboxypeptidase regulatory-like domain-containing protein, partial [Terriglobales bacterium]
LGNPQQAAIQYGPYTYDFAAIGYDLFVMDSWRLRSNLSLELGLRYEYVSPYSEEDNRLVNLDAAPGFTAVAPVQPGQVGPYTGLLYPSALVKPDRDNFAPRVGFAWRAMSKMVVRGGYGINYNVGQYQSIVQQLAYQPPFSFTQTIVPSTPTQFTLQNALAQPSTGQVTNNYGVDPNYRLGYVQLWNLNVQYEIRPTLVLNVGYTGTKGTDLDVIEAPNRGPAGLVIPNVQAFLWETSQGFSTYNGGSARLRKRMTRGFSVGGTYTYSKSIDDASSIGGSAVVVAQNPQDLDAQRGLSSFDMRHNFTADYLYELPFGTGKRWLDSGGTVAHSLVSHILGDWNYSGTAAIQSGTPWTARVLGSFSDVAGGANGSLWANYNGQPIQVSNPSTQQWFNTAAFSVPPSGQFGNAGRNTIIGPGQINFNMSLNKNIPMKDMMSMELRITATNVFNTPHFTTIDTVVNSPTFGQVTAVGTMRQLQVLARFRF